MVKYVSARDFIPNWRECSIRVGCDAAKNIKYLERSHGGVQGRLGHFLIQQVVLAVLLILLNLHI